MKFGSSMVVAVGSSEFVVVVVSIVGLVHSAV